MSQFREHVSHLETDTLQAILHSQSLPPWFSEFMFNHDRLGHLTFAEMFTLSECGCLPKKFLDLKCKTFVYPSYVFATAKRRAWHSRGYHSSIQRATQVKSGYGTSIDQVISSHAGLVPRMCGCHI